MTLDGAVDEDHVVDCRAGPVSGGPRPRPGPSTACPGPRPAPPLSRPCPPPTRTSWDQQQEARHEEDGAGDTCGRGGGVGSGQGGSRAGSVLGQVSLSEVTGAVSCREGADRWRKWKGLPRTPGRRRGVSAACGGRRGRSPGEGATSSPTPVRISTAHKWRREGEGRRHRRQKLVARWGPPPAISHKA